MDIVDPSRDQDIFANIRRTSPYHSATAKNEITVYYDRFILDTGVYSSGIERAVKVSAATLATSA